MTTARRLYFGRYSSIVKQPCCCEPQADSGGPPPPCVAPVIAAYTAVSAVTGTLVTISSSLSAGTAPVTWSLAPVAGFSINPVTGVITGTPSSGAQTLTVTVTNVSPQACGTDTKTVVVTGIVAPITYKLIFGTYKLGAYPELPPTLSASNLIDANPAVEFISRTSPSSVNGVVSFPSRAGVDFIRQFIWIADSANTSPGIQFNTPGFPWPTYPAYHTQWQALTVNGLPGKLYFVADVNNGAYSVTISGATP